MKHTRSNPIASRRAFTLVELLVVISIVALLTSLLLVAFSGALSAGKNAATESLLRNIQTGVQQFEQDFNYLPPLLDGNKHTLDSIPDPTERAEELKAHRYHSLYSLTVYLIGVGDLAPNPDDFEPGEAQDRHDGVQGPGFRDPGEDRSWGGARERDDHRAPTVGRVYGPYIDIGDGTDVLRRVRPSDFPFLTPPPDEDFFPNEYASLNGAEGDLFVIVDRWDTPIRYYKDWPIRAEIDGVVQESPNRAPIELRSYESVLQHLTSPLPGDRGGDPLLDPDVLRAPYALLSAGADALFGDFDLDGGAPTDDFNRIVSEDFLSNSTADPDAIKTIAPIKDNIRTTP